MSARAFITGLAGVAITSEERAFVRESRPWGLILFKRNIDDPDQVRRLVGDFRDAVATDAPVLVDQEGGRVQRLGPPHWPAYPAGAVYRRLYESDHATGLAAARSGARLIAERSLGPRHRRRLPAACRCSGRRRRRGDRRPRLWRHAGAGGGARRSDCGRPDGWRRAAGAEAPAGHGRATVDSHQRLPVVDSRPCHARSDRLCGVPAARRASARHDRTCCVQRHTIPLAPATTSVTMIREVIRGFDRVSRAPDERRCIDGSARPARSPSAARACAGGRLRRGAPLQWRSRRDARGRSGDADACRANPWRARRMHLPSATRRRPAISRRRAPRSRHC